MLPHESSMIYTKISKRDKTQMSGKLQRSLAIIFTTLLFIPIVLLKGTWKFATLQIHISIPAFTTSLKHIPVRAVFHGSA